MSKEFNGNKIAMSQPMSPAYLHRSVYKLLSLVPMKTYVGPPIERDISLENK
jgi:hypothetical protein